MTTEQLIKELGIEGSNNRLKAQLISTIMATADLKFAGVVDGIMTEEEREEFGEFASGKEPEDIAKWVNEKYEGIGDMYNSIIESIVIDLKNKNQ